jgi:hypothetical protein
MADRAPATDYALTSAEAEMLKGAVLLPAEFREKVLERILQDRGPGTLLRLFVQAIGLANSVVANNRAMVEEGCLLPPDSVEKLNLPTLFGALNGVALAASAEGCKGMCPTCAYRLGSPANQCEPTVCDADWQAGSGEPFLCHHHDGPGPTTPCRGHAVRVKRGNAHG